MPTQERSIEEVVLEAVAVSADANGYAHWMMLHDYTSYASDEEMVVLGALAKAGKVRCYGCNEPGCTSEPLIVSKYRRTP